MGTFYNGDHDYQSEYNELFKQLPRSGKGSTIGLELFRAMNAILWDAVNNGFLNNLSGAVKFLNEYLPTELQLEHSDVLDELGGLVNTGTSKDVTYKINKEMEELMVSIIEFNLWEDESNNANSEDFYDYSDPDILE